MSLITTLAIVTHIPGEVLQVRYNVEGEIVHAVEPLVKLMIFLALFVMSLM